MILQRIVASMGDRLFGLKQKTRAGCKAACDPGLKVITIYYSNSLFRSTGYSERRDSTGFISAAFTDWYEIVQSATSTDNAPANANIHQVTSIL